MLSKLSFAHLKWSGQAPPGSELWRFASYAKDSQPDFPKSRFKLVGQSLGDRWKLNGIKPDMVQEKLNVWLLKTQKFLNEVTSPLVKPSQSKKPVPENGNDNSVMEDIFVAEQTINSRMPQGNLSLAAIVSIEQFSRMNGLTAHKMQKIFKALVPESVYNDARNLVEYCCFRFLSRDSSTVHPSLKEPAFQRLLFITMLAWENPYSKERAKDSTRASFKLVSIVCFGKGYHFVVLVVVYRVLVQFPAVVYSLVGMLVKEDAFVRIAPAIAGVADRSTAHSIFKALAGDENGITLGLWLTYIKELLKVHERRKLYQIQEFSHLSDERILCIGSSQKQPVLKWDNIMAWPGKLTLTDKAIYFEAVGLLGQKDVIRLDLTKQGVKLEKAKIGPLGSVRFDSAVSISSDLESKTWVLEFVDLGGEMRRDVWHASISEIIALHQFIRDYGPEDGDESILNVYGAHKGQDKATTSAVNSVARLQTLQFMRKLVDDPIKLVQFSYLKFAPYGDVVCQTLAVNYWGGPLIRKFVDSQPAQTRPSNELGEISNHVFDIDGSIYLRKWMKSPSWSSSASIAFWKNSSSREGVVLSKNLVVADASLVEKAAKICRRKYEVVEKTQATIDAAMLKGIPSNIDLFKELMFPLTVTAKNFEKLRRWEEPHVTVSFLAFTYAIIFRNLLSYVFPTLLIISAASMLSLKGLKEQGRLGRSFGKVTIRDQPPSNTIQKIIAVKDAMRDVENFLQNLNVTLLKIRTIILSGQPQVTTEVALVLLSGATILLTVPFKYVLAFLIFDLFTRELAFRKEMVRRFMALLKQRWDMVPAAPVIVLPFEGDESRSVPQRTRTKDQVKLDRSHNSNDNE
ncbi:hypothetical protein TIFTF001_016177 [Ficus carica]|uniref:Uncharacterized protein n=1 Tax=Ficus carica TaxID=3494 RepID=A0AA88D9N3_FICCA|nr:hypothetical protein TIFTF001_016177 [Ficus carica]